MKRWLSPLILLLCMAVATPALAGQVNMKKLKKWPDSDKVLARSFDVWMTDDEVKVFEKLTSTEERQQFLEQAGYWQMWKGIEDEMMPLVVKGDVVKGMNQDEVYMCWDKPVKIRKDFKKDAYVDILYYTFEIDRKGNEFLLVEGSPTAYKNDEVTYYVYMDNGTVFAVVEAGQEEGVLDDLLEEKKKAAEEKDAARPVVSEDDAPSWDDAGEAKEGDAKEGDAKEGDAKEGDAKAKEASD
ncbi:MAG: hypothetical protein KDA24_00810 [Deltaproteobacteria bacterium]|nr:hypothetical protein [Deltaproteobacteria bacterium]